MIFDRVKKKGGTLRKKQKGGTHWVSSFTRKNGTTAKGFRVKTTKPVYKTTAAMIKGMHSKSTRKEIIAQAVMKREKITVGRAFQLVRDTIG